MRLNIRACMLCTFQSACLLWPYQANACSHLTPTAAIGKSDPTHSAAALRCRPGGEMTLLASMPDPGPLSAVWDPEEEKPDKPKKRDPSRIEQKLRAAQGLESGGDVAAAAKLYRQAALAGDSRAARRLCEIYSKGEGNVRRDYAKSSLWCERARSLGAKKIRAATSRPAEIALLR